MYGFPTVYARVLTGSVPHKPLQQLQQLQCQLFVVTVGDPLHHLLHTPLPIQPQSIPVVADHELSKIIVQFFLMFLFV